MFIRKVKNSIKIIVALTFVIMIIVNILANALPINGQTTAQVAASYPNLFAPAGITFAIWGLIYLLLAAFTLYLLGFFQGNLDIVKTDLLNKIGIVFSISSIANATWIFSWHYNRIPLSMLLMVVILACLIYINCAVVNEKLTMREKFFIRLPFSVYFGWITVATIANATTLLVSLGWNGFGLSEPFWAVVIIIVGMLIGSATIIKNRDIAYDLVMVWAYIGILIKHKSESGFAGQYPVVIYTVIACVIIFVAVGFYVLSSKSKKTKR
ncbi:MAG: tryptophan-rich sensory protein [Sedimentibacter sp.]|uniref:tryptophan-rich sensory protein n=1 Tax=Sedimentibacter sp. TaxID=1960295 RepID=UPI00298245BE|nr:tryptophan-rich sensory protein [Sedimentibacter sp.]MDW5299995.1 tryptophan-rich sensory protein [Sedimentibacter sp.]